MGQHPLAKLCDRSGRDWTEAERIANFAKVLRKALREAQNAAGRQAEPLGSIGFG